MTESRASREGWTPGKAGGPPEDGESRVLLVEDNPGDVRLIQEYLRETETDGLALTHRDTLADALENMRRRAPDVILLDLQLPDSRGLDTVRRVVEADNLATVVVLTGHDDEELAIRALREGAQDYLVKGRLDAVGLHKTIRYSRERKRVREELKRTNQFLRGLIESSPSIIFRLRASDLKPTYVSPNLKAITGHEPDDFLASGEFWREQVHPDDTDIVEELLARGVRGEVDRVEHEFRFRRDDGTYRWMLGAAVPEKDGDDRIIGLVGYALDITPRKSFERELEHRAFHDTLTGLPNRSLFQDRLGHALDRGQRGEGNVAILFLDLDRFKAVNDTLGHAAGDELLADVARRLEACFRDGDTVARFGGDEFAGLIEDVTGVEDVRPVTERIADALRDPFEIEAESVHVSGSGGVVLAGQGDSERPDDLLRYADVAMYRAKEKDGGTTFHLYDPSVDGEETVRVSREEELRQALERAELELHYQPIVELETGHIRGLEALLRWEHPDRGLLPAGEFISLAEETGLIRPIGAWVLEEAVAQITDWRARFDSDLTVSVNVSPQQFEGDGLIENVRETLGGADLPADALELEIIESAAMRAGEILSELRRVGVRFALDDLGTGYSSLEYLTHIEVDTLKADRAFIGGFLSDRRDEAVVEAVALVGRRLDLDVVAEGIEREEQRARLREMGYRLGQGYLFSEARPPGRCADLLEEGTINA